VCHETISKLKQCTFELQGGYYVVVESNIDSRTTVEGASPYTFTTIIGTPLEGIATAPLQRCSNYAWIFLPVQFDEVR